tara:strand:- start:51929 stop:53482 length:1554 start_codon:yes stop_codon:yes gene_type:complete
MSKSKVKKVSSKNLSILYEIALTVGKSLNLNTILDGVVLKIVDFMGVDSGIIYIINSSTMELIPVAFCNLSDEIIKDAVENRVKVGECLCGAIAKFENEIIILEGASRDTRVANSKLKEAGMDFYAGLPLKAKGKVMGVLCVFSFNPFTPDIDHLETLRAATVPIGLAIENALIFEDLKKDAKTIEHNFSEIIGYSPKMEAVLKLAKKVVDVSSNILIEGESGTGKELIAKALHYNSRKRKNPFIVVNCAALPETLLESELFGFVKGAFTGANFDKNGLFELANTGTIFLDEVETMSPGLQAKLLRVLQDLTFFKVGGSTPITVNVRIIAASNKNLATAVKEKSFREDLFYRLNVINITIPPLRERIEDVPLLTRHFIDKFNKKLGRNVRKISTSTMNALMKYDWPGNIRELQNAIERAVAVADADEIIFNYNSFKSSNTDGQSSDRKGTGVEDEIDLLTIDIFGSSNQQPPSIEEVEREYILKILNLTGQNKLKASKILGIDTSTLWRKLKKIEGN